MALFSQALASISRFLHQAWHTIPLWEKPDGDGINAQADADGNLFVTVGGSGGGSVGVEGIVDDADPVGVTKPVIVGGKYIADPSASILVDGDAGYALLNELRMLIVQLRSYDAVSDADKNLPVWSPPDLWEPSNLSGSATADGTTTKYLVMAPNSRWSIQFAPTEINQEVITLTVAQSNENEADVTANDYIDITDAFFGVAGFVEDKWIEPSDPTACTVLRIQVTVTGYTAGTPTWSLFVHKRSNS